MDRHFSRKLAAIVALSLSARAAAVRAQDAGAPNASAPDASAPNTSASTDAAASSLGGLAQDATATVAETSANDRTHEINTTAAERSSDPRPSQPAPSERSADAIAPIAARPRRETRGTTTRTSSASGANSASDATSEQGVTVIGSIARSLEQTPGSVSLVRNEELRALRPQHAGDALRNVVGLHVVPEDGLGMRLNISVRGLDPNRSRKVLILEDGIPVSLNPYGSPELYYTPPIERMDRIEVVRGSGQILYGPQTVGGVINYISAEPPRGLFALANVRAGELGYFIAHAAGGQTLGNVGFRVDVLHRRFNGPRLPNAEVTNVTGRMRVRFTPRSTLNVKFDFYDERSGATYVGPTTAQFAADRAFNPAVHDRFVVRRYALSLWHDWTIAEGLRLRTAVYGYQTERAWRRQNFERADSGASYERICDAMARCGPSSNSAIAADNDGSSLFFRNDAAIRDRRFLVGGIEPRLTWSWSHSEALSGELTAVLRAHYESADERLVLTSTPTAENGETTDAELRNGYALAAAVQHRFTFFRKLHVTPGVRLETLWGDRRITRVPMTMTPSQGMDVDRFGQSFSWALIPGVGVTYEPLRPWTIYAGFHRGYAPPRIKDAVSNTGLNLGLDPELSWNFELGTRLRLQRWLETDVAAFVIEFDNQIVPPSESGGAVSARGFNTGHSRHAGLEASVTFDLAQFVLPRSVKLPLTLNYTWLPIAALVEGLYAGNRVPYAPEHMLSAQLRFQHSSGVLVQLNTNIVSSQFADKANTLAPSRNGLIGEIPTYMTLDARLAYYWRATGLTFAVSGRNLTDQVYVASRAPQGVQPAGYRQVFAELEWRWPRL